jgi:hypothetical protein
VCEARGRPASVLLPEWRRLDAVGGRRRCLLRRHAVGLGGGGRAGPGGRGADLAGEERVDGVQPVVQVPVAGGLDEVPVL